MNKTNNLKNIQLAVRIDDNNPLHHLWNNNGTWWCHITIPYADYMAKRIRMSLKTCNLKDAIEKRDRLFELFSTQTYGKEAFSHE
jgi:hypothetical protein